jgi:hypothetical protein
MKQNVVPKGEKGKILLEISQLECQLRELESNFSYKNNPSHFDIFMKTRDNLGIKISNLKKKLYLYYKTGKFNGDYIEAFYNSTD